MKRSTAAILLVIAVFLVLVALNFIFFVDAREAEETEVNGDRSSYRSTPYGTLALYTMLEESGYPVARLERPLTDLQKQRDIRTLVVIAPPPKYNPTDDEFKSLNDWTDSGGLLIVIDREISIAMGEVAVKTFFMSSDNQVRALQPTTYTRGVQQVELSRFATRLKIESSSATAQIGDNQGPVLADARAGRGRVVLLSDPYVVANNGISRADNLLVALNLFADRPPGRIAFDEYHHGYGMRGLLGQTSGGVIAYFRGTPVPWMMAQAALIAVLVVYSRGRRFARPLPQRRERRATNLEFVSSMANIIRLAHASDLAMQNIYSEFRRKLCRYAGQPSTTHTLELAAAAARRAKLDERDLRRLLMRCEKVAKGGTVGDSELLALAARIRRIESALKL